MGGRTNAIVLDAKRRHRTDIKAGDWSRDGFYKTNFCNIVVENNGVDVVHCTRLSVKAFVQEYEEKCKPLVIQGIPKEEKWRANSRWTKNGIKTRYRTAYLKCGEDDDGKTIRMKVKYFFKYMKSQKDDSPLYVFDSSFDDRKDTTPLLEDYKVPKYFPHDLFHLVGEKRRPPYRWFLIGPKRSGTCVHIDPLGTSAWNTLLVGKKRWVLFPPNVDKRLALGKDYVYKGEDDEAIHYFSTILPRIIKHNPNLPVYEFIQYPGDTVFIPGGWWHGVINLDDTIAVTQNFCSIANFDKVWKKTRKGRKRMAVKWLNQLEIFHPQLAKRAKVLNEQDDYQMYTKC